MKEKEFLNTRVLIIDDEEMVRDSIEEILVPKKSVKNEQLSSAADLLFGEEDTNKGVISDNRTFPDFIVDKAVNGKQGFEKVASAVKEKSPFAVIFLDMRMPGWDGLETAKRIRQVETKAEIITPTNTATAR
jgi:CheY-like chemotaxis protein